MFALTFFGILHVPINVPALGVAVQEDDVKITRELIAHGLSNVLSGFVGSIQVGLFPTIGHTDVRLTCNRTILYTPIVFCSSEMVATRAWRDLC
jgi:hypothetical protein